MGHQAGFSASSEASNGVTQLTLRGELDSATVPILEAQLALLEDHDAATIMVDLTGLTFIDSSGLRAFLQARGRATANNHQVVLVGASSASRRLFELTGTLALLDAHDGDVTIDG